MTPMKSLLTVWAVCALANALLVCRWNRQSATGSSLRESLLLTCLGPLSLAFSLYVLCVRPLRSHALRLLAAAYATTRR